MAFHSILFCTFALAFRAHSTEVCVNGGDPANNQLIESFRATSDPLKESFLASRRPTPGSQCKTSPSQNQIQSIKKVAEACDVAAGKAGAKPRPIQRDCVVASTHRRPSGEQYACKNGQSESLGTATTKTAQCFNDEMADYVRFAVTQAADCLSNEDPINTRTLLKKINNETTFNFSISGNGGRGLMQLTTPAVEEMTDTVNGRALYVMKEVAESTKPSCVPFKHIAAKDLAQPKAIEPGNICDWTSPGDGVTRNVLYGVGYHRHIRDKMIKPFLQDRAPQLANNREIVSLLTAMSFGPEGIMGARSLLLNNRVGKKTNPTQLKAILLKRSAYLKQGELKMVELLCEKKNLKDATDVDCDSMKFTPEEISGATCVGR